MDESNPENKKPSSDDATTSNQPNSDNEPAPLAPIPGDVITGGPEPAARPAEPSSDVVTPAKPTVPSGGGKRNWLGWLLFLIIVVALVAGGWWYYQQQQKSAKSNTTSQAKDVSLLRVGFLQADFGLLYPEMSVNDYSYAANAQIFEGLVRYENKSKIVPSLASTWSNPDNKTWIFTIKKGIKFHDGNTLTAKDVKYSIDKVIASQSDVADTFASTIASVEVTGGNKVKITTTDPDPTLLNKLTFLYVIDANPPKDAEPSQAGTGPYMIKPGTKPTKSSVQLTAFNGYHGGRPTTRAVAFGTEETPADLVTSLKNDKYDVVGYVLLSEAKKADKAYRFKTIASDVDFIGFNLVKPGPLQKKQVREAIRYAINAKAIGTARGSEVTPLSQMIPPSIPGYNPAIKPYKQNVDKAKQLLAQAGYPDGLTLRYSVSADTPGQVAELSKQLKAVGITLTVDEHPDFDEYIDYFVGGKAEMFTVDYASDTLDGLDIYTTTLQSTNYDNPKLTTLFDQAGTTVDPAKRLKLLQDAAVIIDQDIPAVPVSTEEAIWLMDKDYTIKQDMPSSYLPVYIYKVHQ